jgi:hypothetical protein
MNRSTRPLPLLFALLLAVPAAQACSEGMFNNGKGLAFQGYLAPRPAQVLVFLGAPGAEAVRLRDGLQKAGHHVTVVDDAQALQAAMAAQRYDVLITALDGVAQVASESADAAPRVLPMVERAERRSPQVRDRFDVLLTRGASLGQVLSGINRVLGAR